MVDSSNSLSADISITTIKHVWYIYYTFSKTLIIQNCWYNKVYSCEILLISNALASAGNIAYAISTEDWRKLDIGGTMVTLYRLFSDTRFMSKIKKEFIENEMDKVLAKEIKELDSYFEN